MSKSQRESVTPLTNLPIGTTATVATISAKGLLQRLLLDLGFVPGTVVVPERMSPFGDPRSYRIRGSIFALRDSEASHIWVQQPIDTE
jgi:DtxR family Mn-dependent transcriptional regulator